jgi:glycosyltransferase involved in cell wall biosynthesis
MSIKFSIITVSLNSEKYIKTAINSVLSQRYENIEYIIIDGKSNDGTIDIIRSYGNRITSFISEPDNGIYDAMNKGIALSNGEVIGILNSDDFYLDQSVLCKVAKIFSKESGSDIVLGNVDFVLPVNLNKQVRLFSSFYFQSWKLRFGFMPAHPSAFIRRSAYEKVGAYSLGYQIAADFDWFCRAFLIHNLKYSKVDKVLVRMREGGVSTSGLKSYYTSSKEQLKSLRQNKIYSNILFILVRLPIKFIQKFF